MFVFMFIITVNKHGYFPLSLIFLNPIFGKEGLIWCSNIELIRVDFIFITETSAHNRIYELIRLYIFVCRL